MWNKKKMRAAAPGLIAGLDLQAARLVSLGLELVAARSLGRSFLQLCLHHPAQLLCLSDGRLRLHPLHPANPTTAPQKCKCLQSSGSAVQHALYQAVNSTINGIYMYHAQTESPPDA